MLRALRCCLNPKVIGALAVVAVLVWLVAPANGVAALPALIALVCPLSMGVMAWQMRGTSREQSAGVTSNAASPAATSDIDAELRELREEIAIERARRQLGAADERPAR